MAKTQTQPILEVDQTQSMNSQSEHETNSQNMSEPAQSYPSSGGVFVRNEDGTFTEKKD